VIRRWIRSLYGFSSSTGSSVPVFPSTLLRGLAPHFTASLGSALPVSFSALPHDRFITKTLSE